jgi:hypothetical protein
VRDRMMDLPAALLVTMTVAMLGCGPSPITPVRIEAAIEATFANLVHHQVSMLGLPSLPASDFGVTASCRKLAGNTTGAGDWVCNLVWLGPDRQTLRDAYDLFVATDGCYTATIEGNNLGGPTLKTPDGRNVRNLLFTFEGCFDTSG